MPWSHIVRRIGPGRLLGLLVALVLIVGLGWAGIFWSTGGAPVSPKAPPVLVHVQDGASLAGVAEHLQRLGIIRSALYLRLYADQTHVAQDIQAGVYLLSGRRSAAEILHQLVSGQVATRRLTIPEGYTVSDIAFLLERRGIARTQAFVAAATSFANPFIPQASQVRYRLEGYAFPSTYEIPYGTSAAGVADILFAQWEREFTPAMRKAAAKQHLDVNAVMTLASLVEREAKLERERPVIAAVFLNRLRRGMPMQSDPTVAYALRRPLQQVSLKDESFPSPYNTYYVKGLPPGPICNPGMPSIEAVLHPAKVGYLYFYGLPNGGHIFSYTYAQQLAAEKAHP